MFSNKRFIHIVKMSSLYHIIISRVVYMRYDRQALKQTNVMALILLWIAQAGPKIMVYEKKLCHKISKIGLTHNFIHVIHVTIVTIYIHVPHTTMPLLETMVMKSNIALSTVYSCILSTITTPFLFFETNLVMVNLVIPNFIIESSICW